MSKDHTECMAINDARIEKTGARTEPEARTKQAGTQTRQPLRALGSSCRRRFKQGRTASRFHMTTIYSDFNE